jgi:hypothetical protein
MLGFLSDLWRRDILIRLYVGVFLIVSLGTGLYTVYALQAKTTEVKEQLEERVERLTTVISETLARAPYSTTTASP